MPFFLKYTFLLSLIVSIEVVFQSCKKDPIVPTDTQAIWDCYISQHYDSTALANQLLGSWQWLKTSSETGIIKANKKLIITFTSDHKFSMIEESTVTTQGHWHFKWVDNGMLALSIDSPCNYLYGRILICNDHVLFNESYIDGFDNWFVRSN